ncbi:hypothetical protein D3C87_2068910 [compost metagenome]
MRAHLVEKDERPDHALLRRRQGTTYFKVVAEVTRARDDNNFQGALVGFHMQLTFVFFSIVDEGQIYRSSFWPAA